MIIGLVALLLVGGAIYLINNSLKPSPEEAALDQSIEKHRARTKEYQFMIDLGKEPDPAKRAEMKAKFQSENPNWVPPKLALLASNGYEEYGYFKVDGQVKNTSNEPLQGVEAVVTWYDSDGGFVKSEEALIEYDPLLSGQTSPFKSITTGNPAMKRYSIEFKELAGTPLEHEDLRRRVLKNDSVSR